MTQMSIGQCATLACLLEVAAPKPGNVHRGADFDETTFNDFAASAVAVGPVLEQATARSLGDTIGAAVDATRRVAGTNTNLGIILLLAPLASVPREEPLAHGVRRVLDALTPTDAQQVYDAIRRAQPGGLRPHDQPVSQHDVHGPAPHRLLDAMAAAADRDLIARQYSNGFHEVLDVVLPWLLEGDARLPDRIVLAHVRLMSQYPDSLIARKCGQSVAQEAAARAAMVLSIRGCGEESYGRALADLDFWLRSDEHRRNPGTTADLLAAALFAALRDDRLRPPFG